MKPGLKRIEATLGQLKRKDSSSQTIEAFPIGDPATSPVVTSSAINHSALKLGPTASAVSQSVVSQSVVSQSVVSQSVLAPLLSRTRSRSSAESVQPFPVRETEPKILSLPRAKTPSISHHRHAANPTLAVSLLKEIEIKVVAWQQELEQVLQQMRSLYEEGPIVDGWLESQAPSGSGQGMQPTLSTLRHADVEHLMAYIEEICSAKPLESPTQGEPIYRLCGLDPDGQLWSRPCPPQQVPYVSLAIARYQKLRILLGKKQTLENRLQQLVQSLTLLHGEIEEPNEI